jgi:hypothetical protein
LWKTGVNCSLDLQYLRHLQNGQPRETHDREAGLAGKPGTKARAHMDKQVNADEHLKDHAMLELETNTAGRSPFDKKLLQNYM